MSHGCLKYIYIYVYIYIYGSWNIPEMSFRFLVDGVVQFFYVITNFVMCLVIVLVIMSGRLYSSNLWLTFGTFKIFILKVIIDRFVTF